MSTVNLYAREISIKIVYYGPGLGGKTSSLQHIHRTIRPQSRGQLVSLATGVDRTLYFDFLPIKLPKLQGFAVRVQLYTVPGQVHYNSTRKLVLSGADGLVFVADSQRARQEANVESLANLRDNLREQGLSLDKVPHLLQYNKRDLLEIIPVAELDEQLNPLHAPAFETRASTGDGVFEALKAITTLSLSELRRRGVWRAEAPASPAESDGLEPTPAQSDGLESTPSTGGSIARSLQALTDGPAAGSGATDGVLRPLQPEERTALEAGGVLEVAAALSEILPPGPGRDAVVAVEYLIHRGDYARAVAQAGRVFADSAAVSATIAGEQGPVLHALMLGVPGERYLRFRDIESRAAAGGASSADALFALFFLVDVALRR